MAVITPQKAPRENAVLGVEVEVSEGKLAEEEEEAGVTGATKRLPAVAVAEAAEAGEAAAASRLLPGPIKGKPTRGGSLAGSATHRCPRMW